MRNSPGGSGTISGQTSQSLNDCEVAFCAAATGATGTRANTHAVVLPQTTQLPIVTPGVPGITEYQAHQVHLPRHPVRLAPGHWRGATQLAPEAPRDLPTGSRLRSPFRYQMSRKF